MTTLLLPCDGTPNALLALRRAVHVFRYGVLLLVRKKSRRLSQTLAR